MNSAVALQNLLMSGKIEEDLFLFFKDPPLNQEPMSMSLFSARMRLFCFWGYWFYLTAELLLSNPWMLFGQKIAEAPPFDTSANLPSFALHFGAYGGLYFFFRLSKISAERVPNVARKFLYYFVVHAVLVELLQYWVPDRWPSVIDVVANLLGLGVGYYCFGKTKRPIAYHQGFLEDFVEESPKIH